MNSSRSNKTDRLQEKLVHLKSISDSTRSIPKKIIIDKRAALLADRLKGDVISTVLGSFCKITQSFPFGYSLGKYILEKPESSDNVKCSSFMVEDSDDLIPLTDLLFFDTETTGLGGTGVVAFLIGFGSLTEKGLEVRQYLLPDYPDETAMLEESLNEFSKINNLVSYNGAAFDLNLLRDRMIVNRVSRDIPFASHIDLLHSARRLFKRRLGDCSLQSIEKKLFEFFRQDDIPGNLIPSVYFDWLQVDKTEALVSVLEHNRLDILSLYFLLKLVDSILSTDGNNLEYSHDIYSLSRLYGRRHQTEKILKNFSQLNNLNKSQVDDDALYFYSIALKRSGRWSEAESIWLRLAKGKNRESLFASLELAKFYEHRVRDYEKAIKFAHKAKQSRHLSSRLQEAVMNRLNRLGTKEKS